MSKTYRNAKSYRFDDYDPNDYYRNRDRKAKLVNARRSRLNRLKNKNYISEKDDD